MKNTIFSVANFCIVTLIAGCTGQADWTKSMKANVKRDGGKVRIESVERLQWKSGKCNTFIASLAATARAVGEDVTYDYLMGVSGAAFRLHFHQPQWCPSSPDATCGFDHSVPALQALGYLAKSLSSHGKANTPENRQKMKQAITRSIDRGIPVVAIDLINVPDWGVIVGYDNGGEKFLCRTYHDKSDKYSTAEKWPWVVMIITDRKAPPDRRKSIVESLRIAVKLAGTAKFGKYASGFTAYECWIANLLDEKRFEKPEDPRGPGRCHINAWCYSSLIDARKAAVKYLNVVKSEFTGPGAKHLSKAAELYRQIVAKLEAGRKNAPYPWDLKGGRRWTKQMRQAEASTLTEVLTLEKKAIAEIVKLLQYQN